MAASEEVERRSRRRGRGALATLKSSPTWFAPTRVSSGETSPNERVGYFPQGGKHGANVRQSAPPPKPRNCSAAERRPRLRPPPRLSLRPVLVGHLRRDADFALVEACGEDLPAEVERVDEIDVDRKVHHLLLEHRAVLQELAVPVGHPEAHRLLLERLLVLRV